MTKQLANLRKADRALGDDPTLTRWVKGPARHTRKLEQPMAADATGTRFKTRVLDPDTVTHALTSGQNNVKIGRDVRKGRLKGYWIYTLSLEERATCPSSCLHWRDCYGNNMPFAKRMRHGPELEQKIASDVEKLLDVRNRRGILVRLHALGDFYSVDYVRFWERLLDTHERLAVFGYTARGYSDPIGSEVARLRAKFGNRFAVRWSDGPLPFASTVSIASEAECPDDAFVCPEQTGKTQCCATCGACWSTMKNVAFLAH